jgi:hypothetical protein
MFQSPFKLYLQLSVNYKQAGISSSLPQKTKRAGLSRERKPASIRDPPICGLEIQSQRKLDLARTAERARRRTDRRRRGASNRLRDLSKAGAAFN